MQPLLSINIMQHCGFTVYQAQENSAFHKCLVLQVHSKQRQTQNKATCYVCKTYLFHLDVKFTMDLPSSEDLHP